LEEVEQEGYKIIRQENRGPGKQTLDDVNGLDEAVSFIFIMKSFLTLEPALIL
jgi:hypothetical protein